MFFLLFLAFSLLVYFYAKLKYFTLRGPIPGLPPQVFFGNLIQSGILLNGATTAEVYPSLKRRFGNIFQFWLGPSRIVVVSDIGDVEHVFTHRNIYDLADLYMEKFGLLFPDAPICTKGQFHACIYK